MKSITPLLLVILLIASCKKDDDANIPNPSNECITSEAELSFAEHLSDNFAHPFDGDDPEIEDQGLDSLINYLATAKFVGLGEATHGTAEFYRMKDKIFRQLVQKKDFKAIIFEIPWGNALVVNDFVTKNIGSANSAIDQTYYWTYDTQEVRDMAQWIHDYNESLSPEEHILFVGCDPQGGDFSKERNTISSYINTVAPDSLFSVLERYVDLPENLADYRNAGSIIHQANIEGTAWVYNFLEANRTDFIAASSEFEFEVVLMAAHVIQHREELYRIGDFGVPRETLMALYSEWWQRILGEESKVAIWAHNFHVMDGADINADWMGTLLRQSQGSDYKNVAFSFSTGGFNAFFAGADRQFVSAVEIQYIPEIPCHTTNHVLSLVEGDQYYLIFDELDNRGQEYFGNPKSFVQLGAGFNYTYINNYTQSLSLSKLFDVIIHFDETMASELR